MYKKIAKTLDFSGDFVSVGAVLWIWIIQIQMYFIFYMTIIRSHFSYITRMNRIFLPGILDISNLVFPRPHSIRIPIIVAHDNKNYKFLYG